MSGSSIPIVEDDAEIADFLSFGLSAEGHAVQVEPRSARLLERVRGGEFRRVVPEGNRSAASADGASCPISAGSAGVLACHPNPRPASLADVPLRAVAGATATAQSVRFPPPRVGPNLPPKASVAPSIVIDALERMFPDEFASSAWQERLQALVPSHGMVLHENPDQLPNAWSYTTEVLELQHPRELQQMTL